MEIQHNHNAKSQLAKLLAIENITVQHNPGVKTAMFDVKNRVLILPVWANISNDLYDLLVVHEVGHALDTPSDFIPALQSIATRIKGSVSLLKGYLNVIEDARIDKRQKRRYPGSRRNYLKGYAELVERDFFGTARRDINTMTFIDRINIHFKAGVAAGVKFSREELPFVKRIENAETFEEILQLTEDVYLFAKQQKQDHQEIDPSDMGDPEDGEGDGEGDDTRDSDEDFDWGDDADYGDEESDEDANTTDGEGDEESDEDDTDGDGDESEDGDGDEDSSGAAGEDDEDGDGEDDEESDDDSDDISAGGKEEKYADNEEPDESETEKAWEEKQKELLADADIEYQYVKLPTPNLSAIVDDYKVVYSQMGKKQEHEFGNSWYTAIREELNTFKASENATISYMVKEFEMRKSADEYARTSIAKTGVIDTNKLHSYKYNDDIFRRITSVATGKNHGFVMFVDWSGSMDISIKKTLKQMFSLAWFCKRVQIPFEVYSFRSLNTTDGNIVTPQWSKNNGEIDMGNFKLRNILSSRMNIADMNNAMFRLYAFACGSHFQTDRMSSTPLNEAIVAAQVVVNQFRARSKVQVVNTIFLTDGESDGNWLVHGTNVYLPQTKKRKCIIQDTVTKKDYDLGTMAAYQSGLGDPRVFTATLLKILKDHTQCNLIGFFIYHDTAKCLLRQFYPKLNDGAKQKEIIKEYENNGFITVTTEGYDENYILRSSSLDIRKNNLNVDPKNMSKNKIAKQFKDFAERKAINRVLLQRFIKKIAA